jgi:hypothetical protein
MRQEDLLHRVLGALAYLDVRTLVLTGHELCPEEVEAAADARVPARAG